MKVLSSESHYTIDKVIAAGYNTHLAAFDVLMPVLIKAYKLNDSDATYAGLKTPIKILSEWNRNTSEQSVATYFGY